MDQRTRVQTVEVRNTGSEAKNKLLIQLNPKAAGMITEFESSSFNEGPYFPLFDALASACSSPDSSLVLNETERDRIRKVADKHTLDHTLNELDRVFDDMLLERLHSSKITPKSLEYLRRIDGTEHWHEHWKKRCQNTSTDSDCSKVDSVIGNWEHAKSVVYDETMRKWQQAADITLEPSENQLFDNGKISMILALSPGETRFLRFHYSHNPVAFSSSLQSNPGEHTTLFADSNYLFSTPARILLHLHPNIISFIPLALVVLFSFLPYAMPAQLLTNRKLVKLALQTDDYEFWKQALDRYRFYVLQEFRELRRIYNQTLQMDAEEVMDYVRSRLTLGYDGGRLRLGKLDEFISDELRTMLLKTKTR